MSLYLSNTHKTINLFGCHFDAMSMTLFVDIAFFRNLTMSQLKLKDQYGRKYQVAFHESLVGSTDAIFEKLTLQVIYYNDN